MKFDTLNPDLRFHHILVDVTACQQASWQNVFKIYENLEEGYLAFIVEIMHVKKVLRVCFSSNYQYLK